MGQDVIAVIVDLVDSRSLEDRPAAQRAVRDLFGRASSVGRILQPLRSTVGDEFQTVFSDLHGALSATALVRLTLPDGVDCRFGFGFGEIREVERNGGTSIQDGSAWWRAREAIDEAHRREDNKSPHLRGWFSSDGRTGDLDALVNSYLLMRDDVISMMRPRERRLTAGVLLGHSQAELGRAEKITQSAVSQSLRRSGGSSLIASVELFSRSSSATK